MRKIGIDGSRAFSKRRTGTENYSYQLLKKLAKIDHKNKYLIYLRPSFPKELGEEREEERIDKWPKNFKFKILEYFRLWTQFGLALQTFKDSMDVLFVPAHTTPLIHKPGLKTVVTVHDLGSEYLPKTHQLKQRLYLSFMQQYQLKKATKIIAVSKATKEDLVKRLGIEEKKIEVVYEGFNSDLYKPLKNDLLFPILNRYVIENSNYFLFVGTVQPRKNLARIITSFAKVIHQYTKNPPVNKSRLGQSPDLVIVGSKGWLSEEIYALPGKLGVEDKVKFLGYVPDEDMPGLYSGAKALIFPSLFEGFGLPILEAQACGCPVITSNLSSMAEIAGSSALLVDPYSTDDIVEGIDKISNQETRSKIIKAGFENIKRFSWEKCARETLKVLEAV